MALTCHCGSPAFTRVHPYCSPICSPYRPLFAPDSTYNPGVSRRRAVGEGSVYFAEGKQRWVGAVTVDGRRRKVVAKTKTEARKRVDALRRAAEAGEPVGNGNITVGEVIDRWEQRALAGREIAESTRETYVWCCTKLRAEVGGARVRSFHVEQLEAAFDRMKSARTGEPLSKSALIKLRSVLGQALDFAMRRGLVAHNVARIAELPPTAARTRRARSLDVAQARRLIGACEDHRLGAMFIVMLTIGLRPGEAAGLSWTDIDLDAGRLAVRRSISVVRGMPTLADSLKTQRSRRTIDLPAVAVDALRRHRSRQTQERFAARSWMEPSLVFATSQGTLLSPSNVRRDLAVLTERAGLGDWRPNELRHSAASILCDAGVALEHVADLLGHTNTRMLEQTYRHALQPSMRAAVDPMDRVFGGARHAS